MTADATLQITHQLIKPWELVLRFDEAYSKTVRYRVISRHIWHDQTFTRQFENSRTTTEILSIVLDRARMADFWLRTVGPVGRLP